MDNREFDRFIKSKLDSMANSGIPDWERMENAVERWETRDGLVDDEKFDRLIADRLQGIDVSGRASGWERLEHEIQRRKTTGRRIVLLQAVGAAILLLFLSLLYQFYPGKQIAFSNDYVVENQAPDGSKQVIRESSTIETESLNSLPADENQPGSRSANAVGPSGLSTGSDGTGVGDQLPKKSLQWDDGEKTTSSEISKKEQDTNPLITVPAFLTESDDQVFNETTPDAPGLLRNEEISAPDFITIPSRPMTGLDSLIFIERSPLVVNSWSAMDEVKSYSPPFSGSWSFTAYGVPQLVLVRSPFDQLMQEPGYSRNLFTIGAGVGAAVRYNRFEWGTGLEYDRVNYSPRLVQEKLTDENILIHLAAISADFIIVPVRLAYHFDATPRLGFYLVSGGSLRAALSANYEVHRTESGLTALINDLRTNPVYQQTLLSQKEFQDGLMQGAEFQDNIMVSLEFGAGLLYRIGDRWSIFAEPAFHFDLSGRGFGPNFDKLHGISIRTGVRLGVLN